MAAKDVKFGADAREKLLRGVTESKQAGFAGSDQGAVNIPKEQTRFFH